MLRGVAAGSFLLYRISLCEYTVVSSSMQQGLLGAFQCAVIMNSASMDNLVHFFWYIDIYIHTHSFWVHT